MATIKDVASLAGVSTATVSRVINQTAWVEPVTRERVEKAMRDLNYRRNAAAIIIAGMPPLSRWRNVAAICSDC